METTDAGPGRAEQIDFTYRYSPARPKAFFVPKDAREAEAYLKEGNRKIVRFYEACRLGGYPPGVEPSVVELSAIEAEGGPAGDDGLPIQMPFALFVGCSDARVPTELLFGQEFNDIFNIRVAGSVLTEEGVGSVQFALRAFVLGGERPDHRTLRLAGALAHRGCGGVQATIRAFLDPLKDAAAFGEPIGAILRRITWPALVTAAEAVNAVHGEGAARRPEHFLGLVETTVYLNAAWVAHDLQDLVRRAGDEVAARVGVVYGVFDPQDWHVRALPPVAGQPEPEMFGRPPRDLDALRALAREVVRRLGAEGSPSP